MPYEHNKTRRVKGNDPQEVCAFRQSASTADFSTWTANNISSHQDEVSEFVFCIHSRVLSDSFSLINNNKDTESEQAGNFVDETWERADSSWLFSRYVGQLTGIKLQEIWHRKHTQSEETDSRGRQVGRHCTAPVQWFLVQDSKFPPLDWLRARHFVPAYPTSFQARPTFFAGGRHMQSQAAILDFFAHFAFSFPLFLKVWGEPGSPGALATFSKSVKTEEEGSGNSVTPPTHSYWKHQPQQTTVKNYNRAMWKPSPSISCYLSPHLIIYGSIL